MTLPSRCSTGRAPRALPAATAQVILLLGLGGGIAVANVPPAMPVITEPASDGRVLNAEDVHMETAAFSDADAGDLHQCTDWEIWTIAPAGRVWAALCVG